MKKLWQKKPGVVKFLRNSASCENPAKFHKGCKNTKNKNPVSLYFLLAELPFPRNAPISCKNENKSPRNQNEQKSNKDKTNLKDK